MKPHPPGPIAGPSLLKWWMDDTSRSGYRIALELGITPDRLSRYLREERRPSLATAFELERLSNGVVPARSWTNGGRLHAGPQRKRRKVAISSGDGK